MAVRNPWLRQKNRPLSYDSPPQKRDPLDKTFSARPRAIAAIEKMKSEIRKEKRLAEGELMPFIPRKQYLEYLGPMVLHKKLGETDADYQRRANEADMLTWPEVDKLVEYEMGYIGTEQAKKEEESRRKRLEQVSRDEGALPGREEIIRPYLVNISWSYDHPTGRSPPVVYSIEGVFYGWDAELTLEAARDFMMDYIVPSSGYKSKSIMDLVTPDTSIEPATAMQVGIMGAEGEEARMRISEEMDDERFKTRFSAFFTRPESRKEHIDRDFGYADSEVRYRWSGYRIVRE